MTKKKNGFEIGHQVGHLVAKLDVLACPNQEMGPMPALHLQQVSLFSSKSILIFFSATKVDGGYLLNGTKMWITNSYESQAGVVFATSDKSQKHRVCIEFTELLKNLNQNH